MTTTFDTAFDLEEVEAAEAPFILVAIGLVLIAAGVIVIAAS